jgi:hypothetical protein
MTERVRKVLLELDDRHILAAAQVERFKAADDRDFDSLRERIEHYEAH